MKKKITLTIDSDVYDSLEDLPRKVSVSEFVSLMLKGYVETFKKGGELSQEEVDLIVEQMGGEELRERFRNTFGPSFNRIDSGVKWVKKAVGVDKKRGNK
jgi:predicted CopG family antitoxin